MHTCVHTYMLPHKYARNTHSHTCTYMHSCKQSHISIHTHTLTHVPSHTCKHRNTHMHTFELNRCSRPAYCTPTANPHRQDASSIVVSPAPITIHRAGLGVLTFSMRRIRLPNPSLPSRGFGRVRYKKKKNGPISPLPSLLVHSHCPSLPLSPPSLPSCNLSAPLLNHLPHPFLSLCLYPMSPPLSSSLYISKLIK